MIKTPVTAKYYTVLGIAILLLFAGVSCLPLSSTPGAKPAVTVVEVNREVTRVVVQEVTRIVEVPVTVTPEPNPVPTDTPLPTQTPTSAASPTITPTPLPAAVTILIHTECLYGPDPDYLGRFEIQAASPQAVIGRNPDTSWVEIQGSDHKDPCWVKAELVKVNSGSLEAMPVVQPDLSPYSTLYPPPQAVSSYRDGNFVTIFWNPVPMTEADYHGYLIETWVCLSGKQVFVPFSKTTTFDDTAMKAVKVADEPGCLEPSSARIYSVSAEGYSKWTNVPWQPFPTATPTP